MNDQERDVLAAVRAAAPNRNQVVSTHPHGWLHGVVAACTCHGRSRRQPPWRGEGHAPDCPTRQM